MTVLRVLILALVLWLILGFVISLLWLAWQDRRMRRSAPPVQDFTSGPPLIVAPSYELAQAFARRQNVPLSTLRVATAPHSMAGHRGPVVVLDGEGKHFLLSRAMRCELTVLKAAGCPIVHERC